MNTNTPYLEKAIATARPPKVDMSSTSREMQKAEDQTGKIVRSMATLFGVETKAKKRFEEQLAATKSVTETLRLKIEEQNEIDRLPYPVLDESVFTLRDKKGLPVLAAFQLDKSQSII